jgi:glycosyltransferase involved in cell wall biosynthesis
VAKLSILQVNATDIAGGAEKVTWNLFQAYRQHGFRSWLAVGHKYCNDPHTLLVPNNAYLNTWARSWLALGNILVPWVGKIRGAGKLRSWLHLIGQPRRLLEIQRGHEDFAFPGTWHLLNLPPERPDIVHCHNLHGSYFDLRALPWISQQIPVVLTLHDAWLLSGHCAHSFDCERWKTGCGECPDLGIYPAIKRDTTVYNWQQKRKIYGESRLYVATPSQWLMHKVKQSMLVPAIVEARVIPNGIDLSIFRPVDRQKARAALSIPQDAKILLIVGNAIRRNPWRDYATLQTAMERVVERLPDRRIILIVLGEKNKLERIGLMEHWFLDYYKDAAKVASFYQAADIYVHASKADTFPNTMLEALACGTPVVATAVGGIPEQIKDGSTGFLVPPGDADAMADRIIKLLMDEDLCQHFAHQAVVLARDRFSLDYQIDKYLTWYVEILKSWKERPKNFSEKDTK